MVKLRGVVRKMDCDDLNWVRVFGLLMVLLVTVFAGPSIASAQEDAPARSADESADAESDEATDEDIANVSEDTAEKAPVAGKAGSTGEKKKRKTIGEEEYMMLVQKANMLSSMGQDVTAHAYYRKALLYPKREAKVFVSLARLDKKFDRIEQAEKILLMGLQSYPLSLALRYELVKLYLSSGEDVRAWQQLRRFPSAAREQPRYKYYVALVAYRLGELSTSIELFETLSANQNPFQSDAKYWLAYSFVRKQETKVAVQAFEDALAYESDPAVIDEITQRIAELTPRTQDNKMLLTVAAGAEYDSNIKLIVTDVIGKKAVRGFAMGALKYNLVMWDKGIFGFGGTVYQNTSVATEKNAPSAWDLSTTFVDLVASTQWDYAGREGQLMFDVGYQNALLPAMVCPTSTGNKGCGGLLQYSFSQRAYETLTWAIMPSNSFRFRTSLMHYSDFFGKGNGSVADQDRNAPFGNLEWMARTVHTVGKWDISPRTIAVFNNADGAGQYYWITAGGGQIGLSVSPKVRAWADGEFRYRQYPNHPTTRKDRIASGELGIRYSYSQMAGITLRGGYEENFAQSYDDTSYDRWVGGISWDMRFLRKKTN